MTNIELEDLRAWAITGKSMGVLRFHLIVELLDDLDFAKALINALAERRDQQSELLNGQAMKLTCDVPASAMWIKDDGRNIRNTRNELSLNLAQVADHLGISIVEISKWERAESAHAEDQLELLLRFFARVRKGH